jgi:deoxyadenosine/deoxycytidine kinase
MEMVIPADVKKKLSTCGAVVVIGLPCTGKSTVAQALHDDLLSNHSLYKSDDYIDYGYEQSLYAMIKDISYDKNPYKLIEGVQGYRFLRKMQQLSGMDIDAVIYCICEGQERARRYAERGKAQLNSGFEKNITKVYMDYIAGLPHSKQKLPHFFNVDTSNGTPVMSALK